MGVLFGTKNETVVVEQGQGVGGQLVEQRILKAQWGLDLTAGLLLAEDVGDIVGTEGAGGMGFAESRCNRIRSLFASQD